MSKNKTGSKKRKRPDFTNKRTAEAFRHDVGNAVRKKLRGTRGGVMSRDTIHEHFPSIEDRVGTGFSRDILTAQVLVHWGPL